MPVYPYKCENCNHEFDEIQRVAEGPLKKCPICNKNKLHRVITAPILTITDEPKSLGMLAEKNARRMSDDQKKALAEEYKTKKTINRIPDKELPGKRMESADAPPADSNRTKTNREVSKLKGKDVEKYIMTGK